MLFVVYCTNNSQTSDSEKDRLEDGGDVWSNDVRMKKKMETNRMNKDRHRKSRSGGLRLKLSNKTLHFLFLHRSRDELQVKMTHLKSTT